MGGSGTGPRNGGTGPRNGGDSGDGDDCTSLTFLTTLISPVMSVLATLSAGMTLAVAVERVGNNDTIVARDSSGQRAGSIASGQLGKLLRCIADGNIYVADILKIDGAECRVKVHHESR